MRLPISTQINIWGQQLKEFDYWLMFADFETYSCFQYHPTSFFVEKDATHLRQQRGQGRTKIEKTTVEFGIICSIERS